MPAPPLPLHSLTHIHSHSVANVNERWSVADKNGWLLIIKSYIKCIGLTIKFNVNNHFERVKRSAQQTVHKSVDTSSQPVWKWLRCTVAHSQNTNIDILPLTFNLLRFCFHFHCETTKLLIYCCKRMRGGETVWKIEAKVSIKGESYRWNATNGKTFR